jgi:hypothetical protein
MVGWLLLLEYSILCMEARALNEASMESLMMTPCHHHQGLHASLSISAEVYLEMRGNHPGEDFYGPAFPDVVVQGRFDRTVFKFPFLAGVGLLKLDQQLI